MGLLNKISEAVELTRDVITPFEAEQLSDAQCDEISGEKWQKNQDKINIQNADEAATMELLKETETDPLIAQKLERRLLHEIYEWRDLYEDADKELERIKRLRYSN